MFGFSLKPKADGSVDLIPRTAADNDTDASLAHGASAVLTERITAPAVADDPKFQAMEAEIARMKTEREEMAKSILAERNARFDAQARAFVQAEHGAQRISGGEPQAKALLSMFVAASIDDAERPLATGSRVEALKTYASTQPKHGLYSEHVAAQNLPSEVLILGQHVDAKDPAAPATKDRMKELLAKTPEGRKALASMSA